MNNVTRSHHFVPQFYLAGFTPAEKKKDMLWVYDKQEAKSWYSKTDDIAAQRDFYRIIGEGFNPNHIEDKLAWIEGQAAGLFRKIRETRKCPHGPDLDNLVTYIAMQSVRIPKFRNWSEGANLEMNDILAQVYLARKDKWEEAKVYFRSNGLNISNDESYESFKRDFEERKIVSVPCQNQEIHMMITMAMRAAESFVKRKWTLFVIQDNLFDFITSDSPVVPIANVPEQIGLPMGWELPGVDIFMPLSKNLMVMGKWAISKEYAQANEELVAMANSAMIEWADRFIYAPNGKTICKLPNGNICNLTSYFARKTRE